MSVIIALLGIIFLVAFLGVYITACGYGVYLAAKTHPAWVIVCLVFGPIAVLATIIYIFSKRNIFEMIQGD